MCQTHKDVVQRKFTQKHFALDKKVVQMKSCKTCTVLATFCFISKDFIDCLLIF